MKKYIERTSVRDFKNEKMSIKDIETITKVINNSPTSTNTQQFSAIIITNKEVKDKIATLNWGQQHIKDAAAFIIFVADRTRVQYTFKTMAEKTNPKLKEHEFVRTIVDTTIASTYAMNALMEMGYGTTVVGGIMAFATELSKLLDIPSSAFPLIALSVGRPNTTCGIKPKMNKVFLDKYSKEQANNELERYSKETEQYFTNLVNKSINFKQMSVYPLRESGSYFSAFESGAKEIEKYLKNFK